MILRMHRWVLSRARNDAEAAYWLCQEAERIDFDTERAVRGIYRVWANPRSPYVRFELDCLTPANYAPGI